MPRRASVTSRCIQSKPSSMFVRRAWLQQKGLIYQHTWLRNGSEVQFLQKHPHKKLCNPGKSGNKIEHFWLQQGQKKTLCEILYGLIIGKYFCSRCNWWRIAESMDRPGDSLRGYVYITPDRTRIFWAFCPSCNGVICPFLATWLSPMSRST